MTKHTPGPWAVQTHKTIRVVAVGIGDNGEKFDLVIATCDPAVQLLFKLGELRANAHLITAAPDLLEACEAMKNCGGLDDRKKIAYELMDAATAKAKGES